MSTNLQYRLQQHEVIPHEDVWRNIAARLDEEYDQHDISLSQKLSDTEHTPPELWHAVLSQLDNSGPIDNPSLPQELSYPGPAADRKPSRARILPFRLQRVAAVFVLGIAVSALYYFLSRNPSESPVAFTEVPAQNQAGIAPSLTLPGREPQPVAEATKAAPRSFRAKSISQSVSRTLPVVTAAYQENDGVMGDNTADLTYAAVDKADKIASGDRIAVASHPIRDASGNIILDEKLVSAPDNKYVTVTSPNGEQTKISKKFLHALSYMNSGASEDDYMGVILHEGSLWKWLFQEWRQKLLTQPSFIPSAANFLDIMELKEILNENL